MTCADDELRKDINDIVRSLYKKYLKPGICHPGRYTFQSRAENCLFTKDIANNFFEDFDKQIRKRAELYKFEKSKKK